MPHFAGGGGIDTYTWFAGLSECRTSWFTGDIAATAECDLKCVYKRWLPCHLETVPLGLEELQRTGTWQLWAQGRDLAGQDNRDGVSVLHCAKGEVLVPSGQSQLRKKSEPWGECIKKKIGKE